MVLKALIYVYVSSISSYRGKQKTILSVYICDIAPALCESGTVTIYTLKHLYKTATTTPKITSPNYLMNPLGLLK